MNERDIDKHSVNCYFCGDLEDERECMDADEFNNNDGGSICPACLQSVQNDIEMAKASFKLKEEAGGYWQENSDFPLRNWMDEVQNEDTRQGYWEWLVEKMEEAEEDA